VPVYQDALAGLRLTVDLDGQRCLNQELGRSIGARIWEYSVGNSGIRIRRVNRVGLWLWLGCIGTQWRRLTACRDKHENQSGTHGILNTRSTRAQAIHLRPQPAFLIGSRA
jgi:hypothetical protein